MDISTRLRYGARALAELGLAYPERTVSAGELARMQGLSVKYLEHILTQLKNAGIVVSSRGMSGGYRLASKPGDITLKSVFHALEGAPSLVQCVDNPDVCPQVDRCPTRPTWVDMRDAVVNILESTTVADLADRLKAQDDRE